jgi:hypothetical protein
MAVRSLVGRLALTPRLSRSYHTTRFARLSPVPAQRYPIARASSLPLPPEPAQSPPEPDAPEVSPSMHELAVGINDGVTDWSRSYSGLSEQAFPKDVADVLLAPIDPVDIEMKPGGRLVLCTIFLYVFFMFFCVDGMIYLPEIKYRRVLNKAFGPGGWGLAPRSETHVGKKMVSREYALVCHGRCVFSLSLK